MNLRTLRRALDPDAEPWEIQRARERQFLRRVRSAPTLRRLTWLEAQTAAGGVASDAEVAAWDRRVAAAREELGR